MRRSPAAQGERLVRRTLPVAAVLVVLAAGIVPARATTTAIVHAVDFSWVPQTVSILEDDSVAWINEDNLIHSLTELSCPRAGGSGPCLFDENLDPGETFTYPFPVPGVYEYKCAIHIFFGKVKVLGPADAVPDLVVTALHAGTASATAPTTMRLTARIDNISTVAGADRSDVLFEYRLPGGSWRPIGVSLSNAVGPGSSTEVRILWDATGRLGDFEIRATADGLTQLAETDEKNNERVAPASVLLPPGLVSPGIDLTQVA